ncbi:MAG: AraC family transcriptional regulator, partial [Clostridia bacterium]|nr:AraC family transcriptional regulator [Clostridia bacterium]
LTEKLKRGRTFLEYFPHMTIRDIADEMNFYDEYHFSRQFKKEYGVSPLEYKKSFFKDE